MYDTVDRCHSPCLTRLAVLRCNYSASTTVASRVLDYSTVAYYLSLLIENPVGSKRTHEVAYSVTSLLLVLRITVVYSTPVQVVYCRLVQQFSSILRLEISVPVELHENSMANN